MARKVLVVDDDDMNLKMAEFILNQKQYAVKKAASGMECLAILRKGLVDLVLLDIDMPVMDGMKTLERIRENAEFADIPVIFLTADSDSDSVMKASSLGALDYIKKPFLPEELLNRVEKVIG